MNEYIWLLISTVERLWLIVAASIFLIPILILSFIILIRIIIRQIRRVKKAKKHSEIDYLKIFGGIDNIKSVKRAEQRISIEVNSLEAVDFETLRSKNIGAMVVGNMVKCSSLEVAEQLEHIKE